MIEMIPNLLSEETKSQAEVNLFREFRDYQTEEKYIILHSLGISEHVNNIFGEIDFVIICSKGVLCIEVKGGEVRCNRGVWEFINRYGKKNSKTEGPFQQVQGNMQSLRAYMLKRLGKWDPLVSCQYASCVIMPDCEFEYEGIEIIPEILFDKRNYINLDQVVNDSFAYWSGRLRSRYGFEGSGLSDEEMDRYAKLLRGDFRFVPSMKDDIDSTLKALCTLTDEQYDILESLADNERTLVSGVAGAGKTLLAMEQARRIFWSGKSVLYICLV
ncbi:MAG: NERD domain-containing protein/DEAD/DEAH box helicase, partial [Bacteroides thetaiotaomicron]|nr:NERD domain-containing protein/DEAD/DEAH box helicase [Bacteroides thetaiotaomicron]